MLKKAIFKASRNVLALEKRWLKEVIQVLGINCKIDALYSWRSYLKYSRVKKHINTNRASLFMLELTKLVEARQVQYLTMLEYSWNQRKKQVFLELVKNVIRERRKRIQNEKAATLLYRNREWCGFIALKEFYKKR